MNFPLIFDQLSRAGCEEEDEARSNRCLCIFDRVEEIK